MNDYEQEYQDYQKDGGQMSFAEFCDKTKEADDFLEEFLDALCKHEIVFLGICMFCFNEDCKDE